MKPKLIRITTVPISLCKLLEGQLRYMSEYYNVTAVSAGKEKLVQVGLREGVEIHGLEMTRKITPLKDIKVLWQLYCFLKKEKPLIVHSHTPKAGIVGMLAAKIARIPIRLHTVAGLPLLESTGTKRKLLNLVEKATYSCATKVYPNSFGLKEIILQEGFCKSEKLKVILAGSTNGIDTTHFAPSQIPTEQQEELKATLGIKKNDFVFIFVGRLVSDKGINELVAAFKQLRSADALSGSERAKLLLVGPLETELDPLEPKTLQEFETNPAIITTGYQNDVRPYLAISHALVFPSYREGFPNVVMQAGAMELPSIVTNINGCNEIITEGENGTIVPPKNRDALQKAMSKMMEDRLWWEKLKINTRKTICSRYEQQKVWDALLAEYQRMELVIQNFTVECKTARRSE